MLVGCYTELYQYLPADNIRQIVRPILEIDFLLRITKQLLWQRSVQIMIITETAQGPVRDLT